MDLISEHFRFNYELIDSNGTYGFERNGSWFGSVGYLINQVGFVLSTKLEELEFCSQRFCN